jgi:hypothetical protein
MRFLNKACRYQKRLRDGNPCLKDQLEDLKHVGKMTFGRYKEHEHKQLEESGTE